VKKFPKVLDRRRLVCSVSLVQVPYTVLSLFFIHVRVLIHTGEVESISGVCAKALRFEKPNTMNRGLSPASSCPVLRLHFRGVPRECSLVVVFASEFPRSVF